MRTFIIVISIITLFGCAIALQNWARVARLASGPTAWFAVGTSAHRWDQSQTVISDGLKTSTECNRWLSNQRDLAFGRSYSCMELLTTDAERMR